MGENSWYDLGLNIHILMACKNKWNGMNNNVENAKNILSVRLVYHKHYYFNTVMPMIKNVSNRIFVFGKSNKSN